MRKQQYWLVILVWVIMSANANARIVCEKQTYAFGTVIEGLKITATFKIRNENEKVISITKAQTSCGCTSARYPGLLLPGETGDVEVVFDTEGYGGQNVTETIDLMFDNGDKINLRLTGTVESIYEMPHGKIIRLVGNKMSSNGSIETKWQIKPKKPEYHINMRNIYLKKGIEGLAINYEYDGSGGVMIYARYTGNQKRFADKLIMETTNKERPTIEVSVIGALQ